jgi:transposase InsO family protein
VSKARLIITAVVLEGRSQAAVARDYNVSQGWVSKLVARYRIDGDTAFEPRSRRPNSSPNETPPATVELILGLRSELARQGLDAGADTIVWHLEHHHQVTVSRATVYRIVRRAHKITPEPKKKPKSAYIRFEADQPNETWQSDFTHYRLATGVDVEILTWLDDHSRYALSITAHLRVTGNIVLTTFRAACAGHAKPASTLTDNGMVYTTRFAGGHGGRNTFESELVAHRIVQKNSRPNHPTTCGKVERFQQTMKKWLRGQPQPATIGELQTLLDTFAEIYNHHRPHRSLPRRATPATIYTTRPKAAPGNTSHHAHYRVRHDRVDKAGSVTLRHNSRLHHIGVGKHHTGTYVVLLIDDLHIRIINAATGEILRDLTLNPNKDYQGTGKPPGPPPKKQTSGPA